MVSTSRDDQSLYLYSQTSPTLVGDPDVPCYLLIRYNANIIANRDLPGLLISFSGPPLEGVPSILRSVKFVMTGRDLTARGKRIYNE